jgi:hypothetical protein
LMVPRYKAPSGGGLEFAIYIASNPIAKGRE